MQLAELTDRRIKAGKEAVARSLHGNWRREHLHALTQELAAYDFLKQQIADCDDDIKTALEQLPVLQNKPEPSNKPLRSPHRDRQVRALLRKARKLGYQLVAA